MTKGSNKESGDPRHSVNWVTSRRGSFKVFKDRIELGNWNIPFESIDKAIEYRVPYLPFLKVSVLEVNTSDMSYQFGFNPWANPIKYFPIDVEEKNQKMKYSTFSIIIRIALLIYFIYWLYETFI
jgi:hypothetical protein